MKSSNPPNERISILKLLIILKFYKIIGSDHAVMHLDKPQVRLMTKNVTQTRNIQRTPWQ